jgi:hypothetical protein
MYVEHIARTRREFRVKLVRGLAFARSFLEGAGRAQCPGERKVNLGAAWPPSSHLLDSRKARGEVSVESLTLDQLGRGK